MTVAGDEARRKQFYQMFASVDASPETLWLSPAQYEALTMTVERKKPKRKTRQEERKVFPWRKKRWG